MAHKKTHKFAMLLAVGTILSACTAPQEQKSAAVPTQPPFVEKIDPQPGAGDGGARNERLPVTRFIRTEALPKDATSAAKPLCFDSYKRMYSRLELTGNVRPAQANDRFDNPDKFFNRLARLVVKRESTYSVVFATVADGGLPAVTRPLLTIAKNDDGGNGREWTTDVMVSSVHTPYFRVEEGARMAISFQVKYQKAMTSSATRILANVVQETIKVAAPGSELLTSLTRTQIEKEARIIDAAVGKAFSSTDTETMHHDLAVATVTHGTGLTVFALALDEDGETLIPAGDWALRLAPPKPSIFSDRTVDTAALPATGCDQRTPARFTAIDAAQIAAAKLAVKDVTPDKALNTLVGENTTIREYLRAKSWYNEAIVQVAGANGTAAADWKAGTGSLCGNVLADLAALGLNDVDTHVGLWAVLSTLKGPAAVSAQALSTVQPCAGARQGFVRYGIQL